MQSSGSEASQKLAKLKEKFGFLESVKHTQQQAVTAAQQRFDLDSAKLHSQIKTSQKHVAELKQKAADSAAALEKLQRSTEENSANKAAEQKTKVDDLHKAIELAEAKTLEA